MPWNHDPGQRGLEVDNCSQRQPSKPGYCPKIELTLDHLCTPCLPRLPQQPLFSASTELFDKYPSPIDPADSIHQLIGESSSPSSHGTSKEELSRRSSRPYSTRISDQADFASVWEHTVVPLLTDLLQHHCESDFAVDVHNFPEVSSDAVPRVIYITLAGFVDSKFKQMVHDELSRVVPARFSPLYLKFREGSVEKTAREPWWGNEEGKRDSVCEPRNITYCQNPVIGISVGPISSQDAASLGGFLKVGGQQYAMSAYHTFKESVEKGEHRVKHPAWPDLALITPSNPQAERISIGAVTMNAKPGALRSSLTFRDTNIPSKHTLVEMDWCLIGSVPNGRNIVSVPSFNADRLVAVERTAAVEANTEVYALARTSGYSLGFVSDVPGLQKISGKIRREWTVRQYSPFKCPKGGSADAPWQTLKQWVTSGIGVPGDSGAWLIRLSDNALLGLIWGRNHDYGHPREPSRVRLTYFTPIIDIIEDISLPLYTADDLIRRNEAAQEPVRDDMSRDPWTVLSSEPIQQRGESQRILIDRLFSGSTISSAAASVLNEAAPRQPAGEVVPLPSQVPGGSMPTQNNGSSGQRDDSVLANHQATPRRSNASCPSFSTLRSQDQLLLGVGEQGGSLPGLSISPSVRSSLDSPAEASDGTSFENPVRIADEEDIDGDIPTIGEPIRSKASFRQTCSAPPVSSKYMMMGNAHRAF
ncbi:hypothetical protein QBC42DRAFT_179653 [Cladorrhinum samala]|uniref:Uncharacterized protein n=1 Tax=Cladorrhinum samala TaxID=585594 RepID=A0AAV9HLM6_9PEZI|nr:hypothetical protein QBC42DRAFT_179653 [Cladorrhinum samala]